MVALAEGTRAPAGGPGRRGFLRRHRAMAVLVALLLAVSTAVGVAALRLNTMIANIPRFDAGLGAPLETGRSGAAVSPGLVRPRTGSGTAILVVGVDDGHGTDLRSALTAATWPKGVFRSDTIMVLHLDEDRRAGQLVSIPRDSYVPVAGYGHTKINAAFSYGGPRLLTQTVEQVTGMRLDHVVVADLDGFSGAVQAVGGVSIPAPAGIGTEHLDGAGALEYVRERETLPRGDFDRVQRQQNLLRAILDKTSTAGVLLNPVKLDGLIGSLSEHLAVDEDLTTGTIRNLALGSRVGSDDLRFVTAPALGTATVDGASIVRLDEQSTREMFAAMGRDEFESWYGDHQVDELPDAVDVD